MVVQAEIRENKKRPELPVILITGGAGFIGSCFVDLLINKSKTVVVLDKLTYAGNLENLEVAWDNSNFVFVKGDIGDTELVSQLLKEYSPQRIVNFAAETHVDRSISDPADFIQTNIVSLEKFLRTVTEYFLNQSEEFQEDFRFLHVSTDEVYGSLGSKDKPFTEESPYAPNSPYSASKASGDFLVRAYYKTYRLPAIITHCSNNYGPRQYPEKLIPLMTLHALSGKSLPVYGNGLNIRDWIHVEDHSQAILDILQKGRIGQRYNIGADNEKTNLEIVTAICRILDKLQPRKDNKSYLEQLRFVEDRAGHDFRYAIDSSKLQEETGWFPKHSFEKGLEETIRWYIENQS